jgi:hypothetical protein
MTKPSYEMPVPRIRLETAPQGELRPHVRRRNTARETP